MDLTISSRASLSAALLDPVTGLGGSVPVGLNFSGRTEIAGAGIVSVSWPAQAPQSLIVDLKTGLGISASGSSGAEVEVIQSFSADDPAWVQNADWFEVVLVADPLEMDSHGNPVAASRASQISVYASDVNDDPLCDLVLEVTRPGQAAIFRRASKTAGAGCIASIGITGVTINSAKVHLNFGGNSGT